MLSAVEKNYVKNIADIIMEQLMTDRMEVCAWGSKNFFYLERNIEGKSYPALIFTIRTPKIKKGGRVIISYNEGVDTYIVEAVKMIKEKEILIGKKDDVYCDELHSVINSLIEDEETYRLVYF